MKWNLKRKQKGHPKKRKEGVKESSRLLNLILNQSEDF